MLNIDRPDLTIWTGRAWRRETGKIRLAVRIGHAVHTVIFQRIRQLGTHRIIGIRHEYAFAQWRGRAICVLPRPRRFRWQVDAVLSIHRPQLIVALLSTWSLAAAFVFLEDFIATSFYCIPITRRSNPATSDFLRSFQTASSGIKGLIRRFNSTFDLAPPKEAFEQIPQDRDESHSIDDGVNIVPSGDIPRQRYSVGDLTTNRAGGCNQKPGLDPDIDPYP
ncbi:hypothetical protein IT41_19745 [Paracoccus halophilus]|uniref:Uncharacterized protein n=1 Tax=Paracoccus halophilus TaxID=376733 RepID=A0A099ETL3_9RHOB|nr:hypothetical protein IT41_19745 [Paracoccus halophilus]